MNASEFIQDQFIGFLNKGGVKVSDEHYNERREVCLGCPYFGATEPLPNLKMPGCTICGCPIATKGRMHKFWRKKGMEDEPLTATELVEIKTLKGILPDRFEMVKPKCGHPDGDKWSKIDEKYNYE